MLSKGPYLLLPHREGGQRGRLEPNVGLVHLVHLLRLHLQRPQQPIVHRAHRARRARRRRPQSLYLQCPQSRQSLDVVAVQTPTQAARAREALIRFAYIRTIMSPQAGPTGAPKVSRKSQSTGLVLCCFLQPRPLDPLRQSMLLGPRGPSSSV